MIIIDQALVVISSMKLLMFSELLEKEGVDVTVRSRNDSHTESWREEHHAFLQILESNPGTSLSNLVSEEGKRLDHQSQHGGYVCEFLRFIHSQTLFLQSQILNRIILWWGWHVPYWIKVPNSVIQAPPRSLERERWTMMKTGCLHAYTCLNSLTVVWCCMHKLYINRWIR